MTTTTEKKPHFDARRYNAVVGPSQRKLYNGMKNVSGAADISKVMRALWQAAQPKFGMMDAGMHENIWTLCWMLQSGRTSTEFFGQLCRAKGAEVKRLLQAAHKHAPKIHSQAQHKDAINKAREELGWY